MADTTRVEIRPTERSGGELDDAAAALAADLRAETGAEVRFDAGARHLYSTDASSYRQVPIGVVVPRTIDDVVTTIAVARRHGAPITHRGGATSLAGQTTNAAVIVDWSKHLRRVVELDPDERWAWVQPGCVLDDLRAVAGEHGLTFGPDPSTHNRCTLGGMIGNNACGVHAIMAGRTADNVEELDILLYDGTRMTVGATDEDELERIIAEGGRRGEIYERLRRLRDRHGDLIRERFPEIPRRVSGVNLDELLPERGFHVARALVGTEGTCVTILGAKVRLVDSPPERALVVLGYPSIFEAADHVGLIRDAGVVGLEAIDDHLIANLERKDLHTDKIRLLPEGRGWLLAELGGETGEEAAAAARALMDQLAELADAPSMELVDDPLDIEHLWQVRESGLGATAFVPGQEDAWEGWEDAAVAPERLGAYLRDFRDLLDDHGLDTAIYGHFGDGCVHCRINFDLTTAPGIERFRAFVEAAADLVMAHGGSLSGEHGDGQSRAELLPKMFGPELVEAFNEFHDIWDPDDRMNPGKLIRPDRLDENLRLGAGHRTLPTETVFQLPEDDYDLPRAALRCVGVGECRRDDGTGVMCPSYMVTHEEMHSTRGRARLLFEMLEPGSDLDGWRDDHLREALELCLSCKGCKVECPVNVDMATYKAEFLHHHFKGRLRPVAAYSLGLIHHWCRLAVRAPGLANAVLAAPGIATVMKRLAGVAPQRPAPPFASETFRHWFRRRAGGRTEGPSVIFWPDTFTDSFEPQVARAAVEVIERAGYQVRIPGEWLCCGRPLYDFGMLDLARRRLRQIVDVLADDVAAGVTVVGVEPSCVSTFRDELVNLFPHDADALRLSGQVKTLAEFLVDEADHHPTPIGGRAIVHGHCHQKSTLGMTADGVLLDRLGIDWTELDAGCCGLAGSFGFEAGDRYEVSVAAGERKLLPAVRDADDDTMVIATGFSCRTQIAQLQGRRRALDLAEVLAMDPGRAVGGPVEQGVGGPDRATFGLTGVLATAAVAGGLLATALGRRRTRR